MQQIKGGWAQYDDQINTFRAEVEGIVYGTYTGEFLTAQDLATAIGLADQAVIDELESERPADIDIDISRLPPEYITVNIDKVKTDLGRGIDIAGVTVAASIDLQAINGAPVKIAS